MHMPEHHRHQEFDQGTINIYCDKMYPKPGTIRPRDSDWGSDLRVSETLLLPQEKARVGQGSTSPHNGRYCTYYTYRAVH